MSFRVNWDSERGLVREHFAHQLLRQRQRGWESDTPRSKHESGVLWNMHQFHIANDEHVCLMSFSHIWTIDSSFWETEVHSSMCGGGFWVWRWEMYMFIREWFFLIRMNIKYNYLKTIFYGLDFWHKHNMFLNDWGKTLIFYWIYQVPSLLKTFCEHRYCSVLFFFWQSQLQISNYLRRSLMALWWKVSTHAAHKKT